jgi:hypothetical protein
LLKEFVNEIIIYLIQYFNIYGADLLTCPVSEMVSPFFQVLMSWKKKESRRKGRGQSAVFMKLWPILEKALNCTQVFGVVCV